ncbi:hypothetical protein AWB79_05216 [Caballeronia hypogeia]|uniref:Uncharacterized protein n=1 Tax=Caballeronia hypogeia TaxID=1777140 RepID=A0A158CE08_9BURK|nr:hypothetical protein AWB79_05216 [Caballeronia hypogeia]
MQPDDLEIGKDDQVCNIFRTRLFIDMTRTLHAMHGALAPVANRRTPVLTGHSPEENVCLRQSTDRQTV